MTKRSLRSMVLGVAAAAALSVPASAQGMDNKQIVAKVAFEFYSGETSFAAGSYEISARNVGADTVTIRPSGGKDATTVPVITRLARRGGASSNGTNLVFDKVGDRTYLSEVWIPGREGYLVRATGETHEHVLVSPIK